MRNLLLADLKLGLDNLFAKRKAALLATKSGALYAPRLEEALAAIDALPAGLTSAPLAEELGEMDARHDGFGGAIFHMTEAYRLSPTSTPEQRAAAARVREYLVPALAELQDDYATEAHRAAQRLTTLKAHKQDLLLFPVANKATLFDWANEFLVAGTSLDELLAQRADAHAQPGAGSRKAASSLRSSTIGLLTRLRRALRDELGPDAPAAESGILAYFDELGARRQEARTAPAPVPPVPDVQKPPV